MSKKQLTRIYIPAAFILAAAVSAIAAKGGSDKVDSEEDKARKKLVVVEIDGNEMTLGYFEAAASKQSPLMRKDLADKAKSLEFLDKLINMELLAAEAKRRGYDIHAEVQSVKKNQLASLMHKKIADEIKDEEPGKEALLKYYEEHSDSYNKPEKVRARHILMVDKEKAAGLLKKILAKKPSQYEFRRMAQENSEDESTRLRGGDLTFFSRPEDLREGDPQVAKVLADAVFSLKENGEIHDKLVETEKGYHIVMRTGHRKEMSLSFEEAEDRLTLLVKREMRKNSVKAGIDALKKEFEVELHEENLKDVVIDLSGGPPEPGAKGGLTPRERKKIKKALKAKN